MKTFFSRPTTVAIWVLSCIALFDYSQQLDDLDMPRDRNIVTPPPDRNFNESRKDLIINPYLTCPRHPRPADCAEVHENGYRVSGLYDIYVRSRIAEHHIQVFCDMDTDGGGWTVIQRRGDFQRPQDYFFKTWEEYKTGFGTLQEDFWLGNDNIYSLTNQKLYSVRFDLRDSSMETAFAKYDQFWIENEELNYRLHIVGYKGNAGDSMTVHHNKTFTTRDRKNNAYRLNCADLFKGGWWYHKCYDANLNGLYVSHVNSSTWDTVTWSTWKGYYESLEDVEIKIRPISFESREEW